MQTDEYLIRLFIKHGSMGHSRVGKEASLSASAEHANWPGARRPEGGLETVQTEVGQPTVLYTLKIFTQWHTKWLIRIRSSLRDGPQFTYSRTQRLLPVIKTFSFQSMPCLLIFRKLSVQLTINQSFPSLWTLEKPINQIRHKSISFDFIHVLTAQAFTYECVSGR